MKLNVAVQMDPIARINIRGDSTFALLLEAQKRGHGLSYYTPDKLSLKGEELVAPVQSLTVRDEAGDHFTLGEPRREPLAQFDVILLRQDPPFDLAYITSTHFLERIHPKTLVVNNPASVRNAPEKIFVMDFPQLMPPTLISRDLDEINAFRDEHGAVVMKPLHGHGGAAVFRVMPQDMNFGSLFDMFSVTFREPWVIQRFLPEVKHGDKRIILVDGEFAGAVNRVPAPDDLRSNMVRGGAAQATELSAARARNLRDAGPGLARARPVVRRHRRHRRQSHRDQRDLADRHPRHRPARRPRYRREDLGRDREEAELSASIQSSGANELLSVAVATWPGYRCSVRGDPARITGEPVGRQDTGSRPPISSTRTPAPRPPMVYFDIVAAYGTMHGTVEARARDPHSGAEAGRHHRDQVPVVGRLRCSPAAAAQPAQRHRCGAEDAGAAAGQPGRGLQAELNAFCRLPHERTPGQKPKEIFFFVSSCSRQVSAARFPTNICPLSVCESRRNLSLA